MAIKLSALKIGKTIKKYWRSEETYIFRNCSDALMGAAVLIIIPAISLVTLAFIEAPNWANYTFPLLSICLAGIYDAYGRYEAGAAKNTKLTIRIIIDVVAIFLAALFTGSDKWLVWIIPALLLLLCGTILVIEVFMRVKTAIEISEWAIIEEEDSHVI